MPVGDRRGDLHEGPAATVGWLQAAAASPTGRAPLVASGRSLLALLCLIVGTLAAWGGACRPSTQAPPPPPTATILIEAAVRHLDPRFALSAYSVKSCRLVHASLVTVDNSRSEPALELAASVEQPSARVYDVTLRPGLRFHDGHPLTTADVAWTFESVRDPALGSPYSGMYTNVARIEILDELRIRFVLEKIHAPFITDLVMGIVPAHLTRATGHFEGDIVGAGPYRVGRWDADEQLELLAYSAYVGGTPPVPRLLLRTIRDDNSRLLSLMGGAGDLVQNGVNPMLLDVLRAHEGLQVTTAPSLAYNYMGLNLEDPALADVRVRRALAHAIDRDTIIEQRFRGTARPATGLLAPGHWAYSGAVRRYPYDPAMARALLDQAGWPDPDGDGPAPRLTLTLKTTTNRFRRSLARLIAYQLGAVGVAVEVRAYEWGTFFEDVKSGNFQLYTLQWPTVVEPDLCHWIFHSEMIPTPANRGRGANRGRYRNLELDALIERGRGEPDRDRRRQIYAQVQAILAEDLPYVSLWHEDNIAVTSRRLQGYSVLPNARFGGLLGARLQGPLGPAGGGL